MDKNEHKNNVKTRWSRFRKVLKYTLRTIYAFTLLLITLAVFLRFPFVQTFIAQKAAAYFSEKLGVAITIDRVAISFFHAVELKGLTVGDHHGDTLLRASSLRAELDFIHFNSHEVVVGDVNLDDAFFRLHKYKGEKGMNIDYIINKLKSDKVKDTTSADPWKFKIKNIDLHNVSFNLIDETMPDLPGEFQANNIRATVSDGIVKDFHIAADSIIFDITKFAAKDRSGANIKNMQTHFVICSTALMFEKTKLTTDKSYIEGDIRFLYTQYKSFSNFIDSVYFKSELTNTHFNFADIAYYTDFFKGLDLDVGFNGKVKGPVSNIRGKGLQLYTLGKTRFYINAELRGLPNINKTFMFLDIDTFKTNTADLAKIPLPPFDKKKLLVLPKEVNAFGNINFVGNFTGLISDFVAYGMLNTDAGGVKTDVKFNSKEDFSKIAYEGHFQTFQLNLGKIVSEPLLGSLTAVTKIKGTDFDPKLMDAEIESKIASFGINGYNYNNIEIKGRFRKNIFEGKAQMRDPNANFDFAGLLNISGKLPYFDCKAKIYNADLSKINLVPEDSFFLANTNLDLRFKGNSLDNIIGYISADSTRFNHGVVKHTLKKLTLEADTFLSSRTVRLRSDYADADFTGNYKFEALKHNLMYKINSYLPSLQLAFDPEKAAINQSMIFDLKIKDFDPISELFIPELRIAKNTSLEGNYVSGSGIANFTLNSKQIAYKKFKTTDLSMILNSNLVDFDVNAKAGRLYLTDSLYMTFFTLKTITGNDSLNLKTGWGGDSENLTRGSFSAKTYLGNKGKYDIYFDTSYFTFQDTIWNLSRNAFIGFTPEKITVKDFLLATNYKESISLDGVAGPDAKDELIVKILDFPIKYIQRFINSSVQLDGTLTGNAQIFRLYKNPFAESDFLLKNILVNKNEIGNLHFKSNYDHSSELVTLEAVLEQNNLPSLSVKNGKYYPFRKTDQFDIEAKLLDLNMAIIETFTAPDVTGIKGRLSSDLHLKGSVDKPELTGSASINDGEMKLEVTGVTYRFSTPDKTKINFTKNAFKIGQLNLKDKFNHDAVLSGQITHDYFKNIKLDFNIDVNNFELLNADVEQNLGIYGVAIVTGDVSINGPINDVHIYAKAKTERGTKLAIPMRSGTSKASENSFVIFVNHSDTSTTARSFKHKKIGALTLNIDAEITPDAEIQIIFDERTGDVLKAFGSGNLRLALTKNFDFYMYGDYQVLKGDYLFTFENLVNKKLSLMQGGTIAWSGDPSAAKIDAGAVYKIRTTPAALMAASVSESGSGAIDDNFKARIPVEVIVRMKGDLTEPNIGFDINFPSVDEKTRTQLAAMLSNQDELNKQAFALLVLGSFTTPGNAAGSVGGSALGANSLEVISNQLSNVMSQINPNLDASVRYRNKGNTSSGSDEVEVGLSGRLLNDRIIIDGNVGMPTTKNGSNNTANRSSIIDINVDFKVTKDGRWRLKAFNRSNDMNIIRPFPYTQGVGVSYQTQFNRWKDLFTKKVKAKIEENPDKDTSSVK